MKTDSTVKLSALAVAATLAFALPFRQSYASAESTLRVHGSAVLSHRDDHVRDNILEASMSDDRKQAAAEERSARPHRTSRQISTALAQGRPRSKGLLPILSGSGLTHFVVAFLIGAFSSMLLRAGSGQEEPSTPEEDVSRPVAAMAGLPSSLFSNNLLVGFLTLLVIASSLAARRPPLFDGTPEVTTETDGTGTKVVVGKGWKDEYGEPNQGDKPIELTFGGQQFELYLSQRTEKHLQEGKQLEAVKKALESEPQGEWFGKQFHWGWGKTSNAQRVFYDKKGTVYLDFYLPQGAKAWLYQHSDAARAALWDFYQLLTAFIEQAKQHAPEPTDTPVQGETEDGSEASGQSPPVSKLTLPDGRTIWEVGKGWREQHTEEGEVSEETDKIGYGTFIDHPIGDGVSLHLYLTDDIVKVAEAYDMRDALIESLADGFDRMKSTEKPVTLEEVLDSDVSGTIEPEDPNAYRDLQLLFQAGQKVIREVQDLPPMIHWNQ